MNLDKVINIIINSGKMGYMAIAGNGLSSLGLLSGVSGLSNFLIGAEVLYSTQMFNRFLGKEQEQYCSEQAARKLAMESYLRGSALIPDKNVIGIGSTSSLTKNDERPGRKNVVFIALQTKMTTRSISFELPSLPRNIQETMASELILRFLGCEFASEDYLADYSKFFTAGKTRYSTQLEEDLLFGDKPTYLNYNLPGKNFALYPGSWNPLTVAHTEIRQLAEKQLGIPVVYELSVVNADKGKIDYIEWDNRLKNFSLENKSDGGLPDSVIVTNAPKYIEKARLFPGNPILLGIDSWIRLTNTKYYNNNLENLKEILKEFRNLGTTFLVAPRMIDGVLNTLVEDEFSKGLCIPLKEMPINVDVSSTQLRKMALKDF